MKNEEIINEIEKIFKDILDNEDIHLTETTSASDIDEWDSLSHIQLIVAIEKHYKIKFYSSEIHAWKNVGQMMESLKNKLGA
ncbi:MAG TPA: acyl carrier protein [Bacteroidia bacterium]|jgi:acyl carrier protein|nr:acyl carrier protein [Bacteroidia bacterium]